MLGRSADAQAASTARRCSACRLLLALTALVAVAAVVLVQTRAPPYRIAVDLKRASWHQSMTYGFSNEYIIHALAPLMLDVELCAPGFMRKENFEGASRNTGSAGLYEVFEQTPQLTAVYPLACARSRNASYRTCR
jgi:hypothetical protein